MTSNLRPLFIRGQIINLTYGSTGTCTGRVERLRGGKILVRKGHGRGDMFHLNKSAKWWTYEALSEDVSNATARLEARSFKKALDGMLARALS